MTETTQNTQDALILFARLSLNWIPATANVAGLP